MGQSKSTVTSVDGTYVIICANRSETESVRYLETASLLLHSI